MGAAAVAAAKAVGYVGAGTVEFVADCRRLLFPRDEHPPAGRTPGHRDDHRLRSGGVAVAHRRRRTPAGRRRTRSASTATRSRRVSMPKIRRATSHPPPVGWLCSAHPTPSNSVRVDAGCRHGRQVSIHYDAMLAKLICHGPTREDALRLLRHALADTDVAGVASNVDLLYRIAAHPEFVAGGIDTGFIARHADTLLPPQHDPPPKCWPPPRSAYCTTRPGCDKRSGRRQRSPFALACARSVVAECLTRAGAQFIAATRHIRFACDVTAHDMAAHDRRTHDIGVGGSGCGWPPRHHLGWCPSARLGRPPGRNRHRAAERRDMASPPARSDRRRGGGGRCGRQADSADPRPGHRGGGGTRHGGGARRRSLSCWRR